MKIIFTLNIIQVFDILIIIFRFHEFLKKQLSLLLKYLINMLKYIEGIQLNSKKTDKQKRIILSEKWAEQKNRHFSKEKI